MQKSKKILITAALPYANGKIHLGHLAGAYLPADIYARYNRLIGNDVLFICGSDEHGVPITITAEKENISPQEVVDKFHTFNKLAFEKSEMSFDIYSRTSLELHNNTAKEFFLKFYDAKILKEKKENQFYDEKIKMFLPDRYVEGICPKCENIDARGDQCEKCGSYYNAIELKNPKSKLTGETPILKDTTHFYFPLGDFQKDLQKFIQEKKSKENWKENVLSACESWFNDGLKDRAVTRDLNWGVKVPLKKFENKVLYVWFEAVLGYISATKEFSNLKNDSLLWKKFWLNENTKYVAFIGKDNIVFHCIVFPAILMAWNGLDNQKYVLPDNVPANEFLNFEGEKFSKSKNWGIDVDDFLNHFSSDSLRYYLTSIMPENRDSDFYWKDFQLKINSELADIFGNFVNRTLVFVQKNFSNKIPKCYKLNSFDNELLKMINETVDFTSKNFESYKFKEGLLSTMNLVRFANKYFNDSTPWNSFKSNIEQCSTTLNLCCQTLVSLAILFFPILPSTSKKIFKTLKLNDNNFKWDDAKKMNLKDNWELNNSEILFNKIENEKIEQMVQLTTSKGNTISKEEIQKITIDDFKKIDLKIGKIIECEKIKKSEKLFKLKVEIGNEIRQIVSGIAKHYTTENLIGKKIVVVCNLQKSKLMGEESEGMLLAASDDDGNLSIITLLNDISTGSVVK